MYIWVKIECKLGSINWVKVNWVKCHILPNIIFTAKCMCIPPIKAFLKDQGHEKVQGYSMSKVK